MHSHLRILKHLFRSAEIVTKGEEKYRVVGLPAEGKLVRGRAMSAQSGFVGQWSSERASNVRCGRQPLCVACF